jgi:uncharacterized protein YxjI
MGSQESAPHARYRLKVASGVRKERYVVVDEDGRGYCEVTGPNPLKVADAHGTELAQLRFDEAFYVPSTEKHQLYRGDTNVATIERRRRGITMTTGEGEKTVVTRGRFGREHLLMHSGAVTGRLRRRRFQGQRTYEIELAADVDPIPLLLTAVLIDRSRLWKWHDIFSGA